MVDRKPGAAILELELRHDLHLGEAGAAESLDQSARVRHPPAAAVMIRGSDERHQWIFGSGWDVERRRGDNAEFSRHRPKTLEGEYRIAQVGGDRSGEHEVELSSIKA